MGFLILENRLFVQFMIKNYAKNPLPYQDIILLFELKTVLKVNDLNLYTEEIPWKRLHRILVADSVPRKQQLYFLPHICFSQFNTFFAFCGCFSTSTFLIRR